MSEIAFSMSADDRDVTRALQNLIKENAKLREEMARGVDESKRAAAQEREWAKLRERTAKEAIQQQQQMNAAAQKIKDSIATPYDEAKKKVEELRKHLQAGTLTTDEYRKAYANVAKELRELTRDHAAEAAAAAKAKAEVEAANKAAAESQKEYQQAVKEANLVSQKYATTEEKVASEIDRLNKLRDKGVLSAQDHARAVEAEEKKLAKASDGVQKFESALGKITVVGAASIGILGKAADEVGRIRQQMQDAAIEMDDMSRRFGIQGGLSDKERNMQTRMVGQTALEAAVPIGKAFQVATQLSSSGFQDPMKNGTLNTALALMQSSNQIDGDVAGFVKGSGQFLQAFGKKKDQANLSELGVRMQGLFKSTDVQAADLTEFAKAAPVLAGAKMNMGEALSVLTALRETMNAGEASTGARNVVSILQASGKNSAAVQGLASIGLRPDQVDIQGEGLKTALDRIKQQTQGLGEAETAGVLTQIFGRENTAAARILMNSTDRFAEFQKMQQSAGPQFVKDVQTARSGMFAQSIRSQVQEQLDSFSQADKLEKQQVSGDARRLVRDRDIKKQAAQGGLWNSFWAGTRSMTAWTEDTVVRPFIGESETPLGAAHAREMAKLSNDGVAGKPFVPVLPNDMFNNQQMAELMKEQNRLLQRIADQGDGKNREGAAIGRANNQREGAGT